MKFMKLGSKPDIFTVCGSSTLAASDLPSDITFDVDGHKFHLHKFPVLAKWGCLNKLIAESESEEVVIQGFPGGVACFEMCAKYCYGIPVTVSAHNVGQLRCGAEFLHMTELTEKSNLIYKLEVFFSSSILHGWKDSIICLKASHAHSPLSEDLKIIERCIKSISSKACVDTNEVDWSFSYSRRNTSGSSPSISYSSRKLSLPAPKDWWVEDISDLPIAFYRRVIDSIKSKGGSQEAIAESIRVYTLKRLQPTSEENSHIDTHVLETLVSLLPEQKGTSSCSFMFRLLKTAMLQHASPATKSELVRRVGLQLDEASLHDLMIPSVSYASDTVCDVDLILQIVEQYMTQFDLDTTNSGYHRSGQESVYRVAKVVDRYLAEIARDAKMPLSKFIQLAASVPDSSRPVHDALYRAVDMYLKEHPQLTKSERKKICRLMDCKKLSVEACMHAAQNERLPLRVMVQVLFFDQVRTGGGLLQTETTQQSDSYTEQTTHTESSTVENWETMYQHFTALKGDLASIKLRIAEARFEPDDDVNHHHHPHPHPREQQVVVKGKAAGGVLAAWKPEKLLNKLFASSSRSSSRSRSRRGFISSSDESSVSPETPNQIMTMKQQLRLSSA